MLLLGSVALCASILRQRWDEGRLREQRMLQAMLPVAAAPVLSPLQPVTPAMATSYIEVAQKMLFARDRNPNVILDPPPPPPPPPVMPPLPVAYGIMNLGAGPTAILAEKAGGKSRVYSAGERIGAFKIVAMNNQEILFDWDGKPVKRRLEELVDRTNRGPIPAPAAENTPAPVQAASASKTVSLGENKAGPGTAMTEETKACVAGDTSAPGTVQDGMRKVVTKTPFGDSCRWEKVK
jgi:hypothetical protein